MDWQRWEDGRANIGGLPASSSRDLAVSPVSRWEDGGAGLPVRNNGLHPGVIFRPAEPFAGAAIDPLAAWAHVWRNRWLIVGFLIAGLVAGLAFSLVQTPKYRASVRIEVLSSGAKVIRDLEFADRSAEPRLYETARLKLLGSELALRVVRELDLAGDLEFLAPALRYFPVNLLDRALGYSEEFLLSKYASGKREAMATDIVKRGLAATLIRNTSLIEVSFSHASARLAAAVANETIRSFMAQTADSTGEVSESARRFIGEQVEQARARLLASEEALVEYARQAGISAAGDDASLVASNILRINAALAEAIEERLAIERNVEQIRSGAAASLSEVFASPSIQAARQRIAGLKAEYGEKRATLKPEFPQMRRIYAQIGELENEIAREVDAIARSIELRFQQAEQKEAALERELSVLTERHGLYHDKGIRYSILKRDIDSSREQYEMLLGKLNEIAIAAQLRNANVAVVDAAQIPDSPYAPDIGRYVLLSILLASGLAAGVVYLRDLLDNSFTSPEQMQAELKIPLLGTIPRADAGDITKAIATNGNPACEAYRTLRTSLQFAGAEQGIRTILVASAEAGEGKSTTVFRLAADFAALGRSVLVIDADLRKPEMHRLFRLPNAVGLSNLLSNVVAHAEVISFFLPTGIANVTLLAAGTMPPNPADLLASHRMDLILHYCAKKYDLVIIDSPPAAGLADPLILARKSDSTLFLVSARKVTRKLASGALSSLVTAGAHIAGAAFTLSPEGEVKYGNARLHPSRDQPATGSDACWTDWDAGWPYESQDDEIAARRLAHGGPRCLCDHFPKHIA